ncbi:UNVERIFIED_CONTAM: hypothetical protein GTU68_002826 [Idotea baltica]|nr:hypothetical protein [Idotea baltica]
MVKNECAASPSIDILKLDLEDHDGLQAIFEENETLLSQVDVLINNGGISQRSKVEETDFKVYKKLMDVNFLGAAQLSRLLLPHFIKRGKGHLVAMSSIAGKFGVPYRSGYSASKMALHGFFDALRAEVAHTDIKVSIICPGFIKTDISKNAVTGDGKAYKKMDEAQEKGMDVNVLAKEILIALEKHKAEAYFGGFKETKLAIFVSKLFPNRFRKIIAKAKVK